MHKVVIYSKEGCHLCKRALKELRALQEEGGFELKVTDITKDNVLLERYYLSIPVVELDGDIIFQASDINMPRDIEQKLETILRSLI
jgi:glutaredoxin